MDPNYEKEEAANDQEKESPEEVYWPRVNNSAADNIPEVKVSTDPSNENDGKGAGKEEAEGEESDGKEYIKEGLQGEKSMDDFSKLDSDLLSDSKEFK